MKMISFFFRKLILLSIIILKLSKSYECFPGEYFNTLKFFCEICLPGNFCPGDNKKYICPIGSYCLNVGAVNHKLCPCGYFCNWGTIDYQNNICPKGSYCPSGTANPIICPIGEYCMTEKLCSSQSCPCGFSCPKGTIDYQNNICPKGSYCPLGTNTSIICPVGQYCLNTGMCSPSGSCQCGYFCPEETIDYQDNECPKGSYCPLGTQMSIICPVGQYCLNTGMCSPSGSCPCGYFCPEETIDYQDNECPKGSYCPLYVAKPIPCSKGRYCPLNRMCSLSESSMCPCGYYCPEGTYSYERNICPKGSFCKNESSKAILSPPGDYCPDIGMCNSKKCYGGYYCPYSGMADPIPCSFGYVCPIGSSYMTKCSKKLCCLGKSTQPDCPDDIIEWFSKLFESPIGDYFWAFLTLGSFCIICCCCYCYVVICCTQCCD